MRYSLSALSVAVISSMGISQSYANEQSNTELPTINVKAETAKNHDSSKSYIVQKSSSANKLNIELKETPQTVNVVTRKQMDDFNLNSTRDILSATPGVTVTGLETDRTTYTARGLEISNILVDGVGFPQLDSYNYNSVDADGYLFDRIEVIKGADALTNALGDPGATINYVRKRPTKEFQANAGISYGSWNTQRYEADVSGSLTESGNVRARLTAFEKTGDSYLDKYSQEKNGVQAILEADLTPSTTASVGYTRTNQYSNASQWGALPLVNDAGERLYYSRNYNYAPDWTFYDLTQDNYFADISQKLGGDWVAKASYSYKKTSYDDQMLYLESTYQGHVYLSSIDNTSGMPIYSEIYNQVYRDKAANLDVQGTFPLFGQRHELDFGYSWANNSVKSRYALGNDFYATTTDLASWSPATQTFGSFYDLDDESTTLKSVYAATRLHFTDNLKLMLGANYSQAEHSKANTEVYKKDKVSPYAGLTYNFTPEYTGYVSYTSIFRPQTVINNATGSTAIPVEGKSYEIGVKSAWDDGRLTGTLAIFRTDEDNFALNPLWNTTYGKYSSEIGTIRSQGVEVGLAGKVTDNLDLTFGFSQYSLKRMDTGTQVKTNSPRQTIKLLTTYTVPQLPKLKVGANIQWQSAIYDYDYPIIRQDSYALLGLMASYELNDHVLLQVNGNNLTNEKYITGLSGGQGYYGAPANYTVAVKFKY